MTWFQFRPPSKKTRQYWLDIDDVVARNPKERERNVVRVQILLVLHVLIDGDETS